MLSTNLRGALDSSQLFEHHPCFKGWCERSSCGHRVPLFMDSLDFILPGVQIQGVTSVHTRRNDDLIASWPEPDGGFSQYALTTWPALSPAYRHIYATCRG